LRWGEWKIAEVWNVVSSISDRVWTWATRVSEVDQVWTLERILKGLRSSVGESETPNG
jgi:hypothetical protein